MVKTKRSAFLRDCWFNSHIQAVKVVFEQSCKSELKYRKYFESTVQLRVGRVHKNKTLVSYRSAREQKPIAWGYAAPHGLSRALPGRDWTLL